MGGEEEGDAGGEPDETADDCIAVAETFGEPAVEEETDDGTDVGTLDSRVSGHVASIKDNWRDSYIAQTSLPCCRDLICSIGLKRSVFPVPLRKGVFATVSKCDTNSINGEKTHKSC